MSNDKRTPKSESFGNFVQRHLDSDQSETISTLRAEKAELIEALRGIITQWDTPNWRLTESTGTIINQARQTLAKYETK
jgi:hypothetical protein